MGMSAAAGMGAGSQTEFGICPECGLLAPQGASSCEACATALGLRVLRVAPPLPGRPWVRMELTLQCAHCRHSTALTPERVGTMVQCRACEQAQTLELGWWEEAFNYAHAVADLAAPDPMGAVASFGAWNPFAELGVLRTTIDLPDAQVPSNTPLRMRFGVGVPLCSRCAAPMVPHPARAGRFVSQCSRCTEREAFGLPDGFITRVPTLIAAVAREALLSGPGASSPWWLLFDGPSTLRAVIAERKSHDERAAAERASFEAQRLREREQREREAQLRDAEAARQGLKAREKAEREQLTRDLALTREALEREQLALTEERAAHQRTYDDYRADHARWAEDREAIESSHRYAVEQCQRDGWAAVESERTARAQSEQAWQARVFAQEQAAAARESKLRKHFKIAVVLCVVVFIGLVVDMAVAVLAK